MRDFVVLSTADWDNPYWTNKQHVAAELARRGNRVLYIDSLGLRHPSASAQDVSRIVRRLKKGLRPPRQVEARLWVWSPLVLPLHRFKFVRIVNRTLLSFFVKLWKKYLGLHSDVLWTYSPMTIWSIDVSPYRALVYHAVDDVKAQPGMPRQVIERAEWELSKKANVIFTTASALQEAHQALNSNTHYFSNVADFRHFSRALDDVTRVPSDLEKIAAPRIGFVGAISQYKIDFDLLVDLATVRPEWQIVMIGEVGEGDPKTDISRLKGIRNIHLLGGRSYHSLPAYLKGMDVAILPNLINEYTKSMFPMKFYEYLAAGRPIVSTHLPALKGYENVATFASSSGEFIAAIEACLAGCGPALSDRILEASSRTYAKRTDDMLLILERCFEK